jgi:hypothetical protein
MKVIYDYEFGDTFIPSARIRVIRTDEYEHYIITFEQHLLDDTHMIQLSLGLDVELIKQSNMKFWTDENGFQCKLECLLVRGKCNPPPEKLFLLN